MNFSGSNINGYKFIEVVGSGSFGTVYKVEKDGKIYAAKVFSESFVLKEYKADRNRITNEIDALKIVDSDNLVKYYENTLFYIRPSDHSWQDQRIRDAHACARVRRKWKFDKKRKKCYNIPQSKGFFDE